MPKSQILKLETITIPKSLLPTPPSTSTQNANMPFETRPRTDRFKIEQTPGTDNVFYSKYNQRLYADPYTLSANSFSTS